MKKLVFKVAKKKEDSLLPLLKEINKISCKICFELNKGIVAVENVDENMLDTVIGLINSYYTIISVDIDNTNEFATKTNDTEKPTTSEPELPEDFVRKVGNEYIDNKISALCKSVYWSLSKCNATEKELGDYIQTCISKISMRYSKNSIIEFEIGDVVEVDFDYALPGELYKKHMHAIVVSLFNEEQADVIPITKNKTDSRDCICFEAPEDVIYYNDYFTGGSAIADRTIRLRTVRFISVVGKTKKEFFKKLIEELPKAYDFRKEYIDL